MVDMVRRFVLRADGIPSESEAILKRTLRQFLDDRGCRLGDEGYAINLRCDDEMDDGYDMEQADNGVLLTGGRLQNLFAAVGRFLQEADFDGHGGFVPPPLPLRHRETVAVRGMYYATHFHNFYQDAPLSEIFDQITDLALRDTNALLVWFDMHTYHGTSDPDAVLMIERLKRILKHAEAVGIKPSMLMLANEGFAGTPEAIRAENAVQNGYTAEPQGFYHTEICPSKPGGREELFRQRREMLAAFQDVDLQYVCYWPYDQGGCTCAGCAPWGGNGFLRLLPEFRETVRAYFPQTEILLSTWFFDRNTMGEWQAMASLLKDGLPDGVSHIMSYFFEELPEPLVREGLHKRIPFISFPEISMQGAQPWGGFGANPLPCFLEDRERDGLYRGGFPYSEGVFEDLNKWICLHRFAGITTDSREAVKRYLKYTCCYDGEDLLTAVMNMEKTLPRYVHTVDGVLHCDLYCTEEMESIYQTVLACEEKIPLALRNRIPWRLLKIRATLDWQLLRCDGIPSRSASCQALLGELVEMYHAEQALSYVKPPINQ